MHVTCRTFWLQKADCSPDEYEDAFAPRDKVDTVTESFKCAVADGATETSFAALWAQLLVDDYVAGEQPIEDIQQIWKEKTSGLTLAWYAEEKLQSGAFAALVGLTLTADSAGQGKWEAKAIGDSCLFHIRGGELLKSLPLTRWEEFGSNPVLISTNQSSNERVGEHLVTSSGTWETGDVFYLMSDAISCWFLRCYESKRDTALHLLQINNQDVFADVVSQQRSLSDPSGMPLMRNDDVTMMRVELN